MSAATACDYSYGAGTGRNGLLAVGANNGVVYILDTETKSSLTLHSKPAEYFNVVN